MSQSPAQPQRERFVPPENPVTASPHHQITKSPHHQINTLALILARAGSKGLPGKNTAPLLGRPLVHYSIGHARSAGVDRIALSSDDPEAARIAARRGVDVIDRPALLANDAAPVDAAARHALQAIEARDGARYHHLVILYANVPLRPPDLIDRALGKLRATGCDSVQPVEPVGKHHPLWMRTLGGEKGDRLAPYQPNRIHRRQDLPPVYALNGGLIAATRRSLLAAEDAGDPHAFLGSDQRAVVTRPGQVVDIDERNDLHRAEAVMRARRETSPATLRIADRRIGPGCGAYVIAELGVNHDGSAERALMLTRAAAEAGANAVKLQLFEPDALLSAEAELAGYQRQSESEAHAMLRRLQLPEEAMRRVRDEAHRWGLGFIVTCFSPSLATHVEALRPDAIKIASPDVVNRPLLTAMKALGPPLLISTGTSDAEELEPTVELLADHPCALLHCVSAYPAPTDRADLGRIGRLAERFGGPVGYSDHTDEPHAGALAVAQGAAVIEKHLTHDRAAPGPDHAASFEPAQFRRYVELIRSAEAMHRSPIDGDEQAEVRRVARQSVCAAADLEAGRVLRRADLTVKRPGTGIPAARLAELVGRTLQRPVRADHLLHDHHFHPGCVSNAAEGTPRSIEGVAG